jgi:bla regulator protein BlaR1
MGELATEGHIILEVEEKDNIVKAYTISSVGYFGFENGIFKKISGSSDGYDVITFKKSKSDGTILEKRIYKIVGSEPELQQQ